MLADDLVRLAKSQKELQKMAGVIHAYSCTCRSKRSPIKSVVVVFCPSLPNNKPTMASFGTDSLPVLENCFK